MVIVLYSIINGIISWLCWSCSNTSTAVEYPVFVFLIGGNPKSSNSTTPNCLGEAILNSEPAKVYMLASKVFILSSNSALISSRAFLLTCIPSNSILANTLATLISIRLYKSVIFSSASFSSINGFINAILSAISAIYGLITSWAGKVRFAPLPYISSSLLLIFPR